MIDSGKCLYIDVYSLDAGIQVVPAAFLCNWGLDKKVLLARQNGTQAIELAKISIEKDQRAHSC